MKLWDWMPWYLFFWMLSFKPAFSLSSFTFIKRPFSYSLLSAIRVVSYAYLKLFIFLPILIPACASFSPAFRMMYSAWKLNKQGDNIQPWPTPFPILNQSIVPCLVLIVASDLHTGFTEAGKVVWYSHLFKNFPQFVVIYIVKGFSIVNEAKVDVFLEFSCFFCDPANVDNLISGSSAFSKTSLYICKFLVHILLKPSLKDFEHYFTSMWNECSSLTAAIKLKYTLLGRKTMTNLDGILKSRDKKKKKKQRHHFIDRGSYSPSCDFFPVVTYECEN